MMTFLIVCKANSGCSAKHFEESVLRPLLRQVLVATAAAVKSHVLEKANSEVEDVCWAELESPQFRKRLSTSSSMLPNGIC